MGQLIEWPEVITEGKTIEECCGTLRDALHEMTLAYREQEPEDTRQVLLLPIKEEKQTSHEFIPKLYP